METIKAMAVEPQARRRWERQLAGYISTSFRTISLGSGGSQTVAAINKLSMALVLWLGALAVMDGTLTIGQLVAFNMLAGQVSQPILRLAQMWQDFQQFRISISVWATSSIRRPRPCARAHGMICRQFAARSGSST